MVRILSETINNGKYVAIFLTIILLQFVALQASAQVEITSPSPSGLWGIQLSAIGDVNGDGTRDIIIGAEQEERGVLNEGIVYLYNPLNGEEIHSFKSPDAQIDGLFGKAVSAIGDINNDGISDIVVGAPGEDTDDNDALDDNQGRVYIMSGVDGSPLLTIESPNPEQNGLFGSTVKGVQDINNDGIPDFLVGAPEENKDAEYPGRAYLFSGEDGALLHAFKSPNPRENASTSAEGFGFSLTDINDVNNDGFADIVIGAWREDNPNAVGTARDGQVYIFNGLSGNLIHTISSPNTQANGSFGYAVETTADMTGDGSQDLLVGAKDEDIPDEADTREQGRVYLVNGSDGEVVRTFDSPFIDESLGFGKRISSFQDFNVDGIPDFLAGLTSAGDGGRLFIISGGNGAILKEYASPNDDFGDGFGFAFDVLDDMDNTGVRDLVISAPGENIGFFNSGKVYIFKNGEAEISDQTAPSPPLNLTLNSENEQIKLNWEASSVEDVEKYNIYRTTNRFELDSLERPDPDLLLDNIPADQTIYIDESALVKQNYFYRVTAIDTAGNESSFSNKVEGLWVRDESTDRAEIILTIEPPDSINSIQFGEVVEQFQDITGDSIPEILVTAGRDTVDDKGGAGRLYMFDGSDGSLIYTVTSPASQNGGEFSGAVPVGSITSLSANSVDIIDDIDNDGVVDFAVGAPSEDDDNPSGARGRAYLFSGADGQLLQTFLPPGSDFTFFGAVISAIGDINSDGIRDVLISDPIKSTNGFFQNGEAYAYDPVTGNLIYRVISGDPEDIGFFGAASSRINDIDGDEVDDFAVGAPEEQGEILENGFASTGVVYLFSGRTGEIIDSLFTPSDYTGSSGGAQFGASLVNAGDLNGDGTDELLVADNAKDIGPEPEGIAERALGSGIVYIIDVKSNNALTAFFLEDAEVAERFGTSLAKLDDLDGDNIPDFAISAPRRSTTVFNQGRVDIVSGSDGRLLKILTAPEPKAAAVLGIDIAGGADFNNDGFSDVIATSFEELEPDSDKPFQQKGRIYIFSGKPDRIDDADDPPTDGSDKFVLFETFEATPFPPEGWQIDTTLAEAAWFHYEHNGDAVADSSSFSATVNWINQDHDEWLITPSFSLVDSDDPLLEFDTGYFDVWVDFATLKLHVNTNRETPAWSQVWEAENEGFEEYTWRHIEIALSAFAGEDFVQLAWQYVGRNGYDMSVDNVKVIDRVATPLAEDPEVPNTFKLSQNYPNPFNPSTTITYTIPKATHVTLDIYNLLGRRVQKLVDKSQTAGSYSVTFNASSLASGMFIYRISAGSQTATKKMILIK